MNLWTIAKLAVAYQAAVTVNENVERHKYWRQARTIADQSGKPLLVVGMKRFPWQPDNGDVTVDLDPTVEEIPGGVWADERLLPFPDGEFGAVYNAHTLEHLSTPDDVETAVNECLRVADVGIFLCPSPYNPISTLFNPSHHLRLWFDQQNNRIKVTDNRWRTGFGLGEGSGHLDNSESGPRMQALVTSEMPEIIKTGSVAYFI